LCTVNTDCEDSNVCTTNLCNVSNGSCIYPPIAGCNPNQQCKADLDCNDNNKCTADVCNTFNSTCVHVNFPGCTP
jgi:hypothetical protein